MANTYTQFNIHGIFAVKGRENIITKNFRDNLHKYIFLFCMFYHNVAPMGLTWDFELGYSQYSANPFRYSPSGWYIFTGWSSGWVNW